ncbi:monooxygenase [Actinoplanes sp. NPDC026623]|uniref:monooxygenase n=1 Tax=Actinoplanes sp. NPDC026623 TaxID=3155610 RepID=UPI0034087DEE
MTTRIRSVRMVAVAAAAATVAVTACSPGGGAASVPSASPHAGHGGSSPAPAQPLRPGERFLQLTMERPYAPSAPDGGTDEYRCLLIDPKLSGPAFLTGTQFQPQNVPIVHHAIVFAVPPDAASEARAVDARTPGDGWTCFGDGSVDDEHPSAWVDTWTPNGTETVLRQDVGFPLRAGSLLVLQIHYNLLATGGRAGATDRSGVRLRLTAGTAATKPLEILPLQAPTELPCAAGESGPLCDRAAAVADVTRRFGPGVGRTESRLVDDCSAGTPVPGDTQHCDIPVPRPMTVYAALGHMHLLGRAIKIEINPGTAGAQTLLDVPSFNFDDQLLRPLAAPVRLKPGDTVRVTCTHDAGLRRLLPQLRGLAPRYVVWGDGTSDEMCLGLLTATIGD